MSEGGRDGGGKPLPKMSERCFFGSEQRINQLHEQVNPHVLHAGKANQGFESEYYTAQRAPDPTKKLQKKI